MEDLTEKQAIALLKEGSLPLIGGARLSNHECKALVSLLIEADSFISHQRHRGSWPEDEAAVDALIGRLRRAS